MGEWKNNESLAGYTTFKVGGEAEYFVRVGSEEEVRTAAGEARRLVVPITVIGGGSNVLVADTGVVGLVIKNQIGGIGFEEDNEGVLVTAGAGVEWDELVAFTVERGWWGMENLSAIPGSVGATPIQNVGAYGIEVAEIISNVRVYDVLADEFKNMSPIECNFGYRDSIFKTDEGKRYIVVAVTYRLSKTPTPRLHYKDLSERFGVSAEELRSSALTPAAVRNAVIDIRSGKFPDTRIIGTAGSFFKNPIISEEHFTELQQKYPDISGFSQGDGSVKVSLGWVLDKVCNLRGYREGSVGTYEKQSLVLVNHGGATAEEIKNFATKISENVFEKTKIKIDWEVNQLK